MREGPDAARIEGLLAALWIAAPAGLRDEDRKKARELEGLLAEVARIGRRARVVDAAAGNGYAGIVAAALLGRVGELVTIERTARLAERTREAAARAAMTARLDARVGDVGDAALWPHEPDVALALHACGGAADAIMSAAVAARARWILVAPCCYARGLTFFDRAERRADALGLPADAALRGPFVRALVDARRALRLEAAGWETAVVPFVAPTVTPHNLLFRARRVGEPARMREAAERLARLEADDAS